MNMRDVLSLPEPRVRAARAVVVEAATLLALSRGGLADAVLLGTAEAALPDLGALDPADHLWRVVDRLAVLLIAVKAPVQEAIEDADLAPRRGGDRLDVAAAYEDLLRVLMVFYAGRADRLRSHYLEQSGRAS